MKCKVIIYTFLCMLLFGTLSCKDDLLYDNEQVNKGECVISGSVKFKPFTSALSTRTAGDAIKDINSLCVLLYDEDGKLVNKYPIEDYEVKNLDRTGDNIAEAQTPCATFKLKVPYGTYIIYAVTNMGDLSEHAEEIKEVDKLKNISLQWEKDVASNGQMFGHFFSEGEPVDNEAAKPLVIDKSVMKLQAWVRRAASKVTVAFDGSKLNEGVSITLRALRIKNIPRTCKLGADNTVESKEGLIETGEEVTYEDAPLITMEQPYYPRVEQTGEDGTISWIPDPDRHSETNPNSLFFYENMQDKGPDKQDRKDDNDDGILDGMYPYNEKPYATYIEVDTHYESTNPERPGICNITYRFMLGQDVNTDYNAKRNCHYKLTLHFNGFADEPDWRIDYVTRLGVTQPEVVDYRGKYFVPDNVTSNQGNTFSDKNIITVTSFMYENDSWTNRKAQPYKIEFRDAGSTEFSETPPTWLNEKDKVFSKTDKGNGIHELKINYINPYTSESINEILSKRPTKSGTYDLSTKGGSTSMNTANCYIVDSKGTYQFPLVYGNAIVNGGTNETSYKHQVWGNPPNYLKTFLNYKNNVITSPYILKDIYGTTVPAGLTASLVWQDEKDLVTNIAYIPGDPGAIKFEVNNPKEGNAVIALKDPNGTVMWSWHIWVTAVDLSRTLILTNNAKYGSRKYEIMPVNLGWCSGGIPVRYYDRHECEVKFTQLINKGEESEEGVSQIVKIVQEPHIALPCGNNPYYQHGRKDPFVAGGDANDTNKQWYDASGNSSTSAPQTIIDPDPAYDLGRINTNEATALLIKNPDKWQNCPHEVNPKTDPNIVGDYIPKDNIFFNLWDNSCWDDNDDVVKTVYDPCPVGYHVSSIYTFSGFTDYGESVSGDYSTNTYGVIENNMLDNIEDKNWDKSVYKNNIVEFYTDKTKLISIGFPANGYRDWDDNAKVWQYGQGEVWCAQGALWSPIKINGTDYYPNAYHLEFTRLTTDFTPHIFPWNNYYATDGMAVRPTRTLPK